MNVEQIKNAVKRGERVYWSNVAYEVIEDSIGQWLIKCELNDHCIGLTHMDETTLNGDEEDFFMWSEREALFSKLVQDDINSIVASAENFDYSYLTSILIGDGVTQYGAMSIHELNAEWQERLIFIMENE